MKKILMILALMLPMVVFTACEKDGDDLVGRWFSQNIEDISYIQFDDNHTGRFAYTSDEDIEDDEYGTFTWSATKNHLTIDFGGDVEEYTYSIDGKTLTMTYIEDNETFIFKRQ